MPRRSPHLPRLRLSFLPRQLLAEPTARADAIPVLDERERHNAHGEAQEADQAARPSHTQRVVHGRGGEGQDRAQQAAGAGGGGQGAGGVDLVAVDEVVQHGHEEEEVADAPGDAAEDGDDPVDVCLLYG